MNDFEKYNKISGVYWLKHPIDMLSMRIKTKALESIIHLPKFEVYNQPTTLNLEEKPVEENIFKWQEKVFSNYEIEKYSNVHNCMNDIELGYYKKLENTESKGNRIFTLINEDCELFTFSTTKEKTLSVHNFNCFKKLNLEPLEKHGRVFNNRSSSITHLFRSDEDISLQNEQWITMHVVYDNSKYSEDTQLLFKHEHILLSLFYNTEKKYLILSPDTNDINLNPYSIDGDNIGIQYSVEIDYGTENSGEDLVLLLNKLHKKLEKKQKELIKFTMPPLGKKKIHVSLEIVSAKRFDMDNIYIEYHLKIPDDIQCDDTLRGKTHTAEALVNKSNKEWMYGHIVEIEMEVASVSDPPPIKVYLEIISTDWWGRHRTEGYTYFSVGLHPGCYSRVLLCTRPEELDIVEAESRRFFVGGCHLIKDLEVLDKQMQTTNYRFTTTGTVFVRWSTVAASGAPRVGAEREGGSALRAADAALRRYRRARAKLAVATLQ